MEIKKEIKKESYAVKIVAEENGTVLGRAYLYVIFNDLSDRPYGLLEDVFVAEGARKRGVGTQLVQVVVEEAKERKLERLICTSRYARPEVHAWYLKMGFTDYGKEFKMDLK